MSQQKRFIVCRAKIFSVCKVIFSVTFSAIQITFFSYFSLNFQKFFLLFFCYLSLKNNRFFLLFFLYFFSNFLNFFSYFFLKEFKFFLEFFLKFTEKETPTNHAVEPFEREKGKINRRIKERNETQLWRRSDEKKLYKFCQEFIFFYLVIQRFVFG